MKVDKQSFDGVVCFNDENHKYFKNGSKDDFISVTTLIHRFAQEFDEEFWSRYKALQKLAGEDAFDGPFIGKSKIKRGPASAAKQALLDTKVYDHKWSLNFKIPIEALEKEAEQIREYYKEEREKSCFRGTKIHKNFEDSVTSKSRITTKFLGSEISSKITGEFKYSSDNRELLPGNIYPELLLYRISDDGILRIAGQVDLPIIDHDGGVFVVDFKTNKKIDTKSYFNQKTKRSVKMKYPLNNLDDCNFNHYQLQLSLYYWLINKSNPTLHLKGLYILHIDHDSNETMYECSYLKDEVERMLVFYKKEKLNEMFKESTKPITF
jgi:hypothetical protein